MEIKCITKTLQKSLHNAEYFVGKNLDLPVLSCILLEAEDNFLKISSTNINTAFKSEIPVNVKKPGKVAVIGEVFSRTIANISDDEVDLILDGNVLTIKSEKNKIELNTVDYNDFPTILDIESMDEPGTIIKMDSKDFANGINSTLYASSKSAIKPELASVYF
jgi:DNA polymerase-3 subunit beta